MPRLDDQPTSRAWEAIGRIVLAHVAMLAESGILDAEGRGALLSAIDSTRRGEPAASRLLDLLIAFDERVDAVSPPGMIGTAAVGRGAAEVVAATMRLLLRDDLLLLAKSLHTIRSSLLELATTHAVTVMPAFSGGQPAQPTTLSHFLGGLIGPLGRASAHLTHVYSLVDQSPLGAGALAATAIDVDRERQAELLGFTSVIENTFDAVVGCDHVLACADLSASVASSIGRVLTELMVWLRAEPGILRLTAGWTRREPGLPQLTPATGLIDLRQLAAAVIADATSVRQMVVEAPFEPLTPFADRILAVTDRCLSGAATLAAQTGALLSTGIEINRASLANRAGRDFSTIGDLADFLMIEEGLEPAAARAIASLTYRRAAEAGLEASGITPEIIDGVALMVIGREVGAEFEAISRYLAPRRFIERRTGTGGPAPVALRAFLDRERERLADDDRWRTETVRRLEQIFAHLERSPEESHD